MKNVGFRSVMLPEATNKKRVRGSNLNTLIKEAIVNGTQIKTGTQRNIEQDEINDGITGLERPLELAEKLENNIEKYTANSRKSKENEDGHV